MKVKMNRTCPSCGASVDPRKAACPYCGTVYDPDHLVEKEIHTRTRTYTGTIFRLIIILGLLAAILVSVGVGENSWEVVREMRQSESDKKAEEYRKEIDRYLADGDYLGLNSFREYHELRIYDGPYKDYRHILSLAGYFSEAAKLAIRIELPSEDDIKYGWVEDYEMRLGEALESFFSETEHIRKSAEDDWFEEEYGISAQMPYIEDMEAELYGIMKTWFGMSREEVDELLLMNKGERMMKIREADDHE